MQADERARSQIRAADKTMADVKGTQDWDDRFEVAVTRGEIKVIKKPHPSNKLRSPTPAKEGLPKLEKDIAPPSSPTPSRASGFPGAGKGDKFMK